MSHPSPASDPMTPVLATFRDPESTGFDNAWVGMEPTFQSRKSVRKWRDMSAEPGGDDAYFLDGYMLRTQKKVARAIRSRYEQQRAEGAPHCMFAKVGLSDDLDQWQVRRQNLLFHWADRNLDPFEVRLSLDPETFEYSIKPVPLAWFCDARFVAFLKEFVWKVPRKQKLPFAIAHGGGQFSLSAKTFLTGSLLADDVAYKAGHAELSTWIMDWPNPDDRSFRATRRRGLLGRSRAGMSEKTLTNGAPEGDGRSEAGSWSVATGVSLAAMIALALSSLPVILLGAAELIGDSAGWSRGWRISS